MNGLYQPFQPTLTETGLKRFGLVLQTFPASVLLRDVIYGYLQISAQKPTPYPVMPDGTQALFISPHGSKIGGAQTRACDVPILQPGDYFGIWFYPGALRHFFDLDLSEITNQFVDHHYFPCRNFGELHNKIYQNQNFCERAQVCEQWLLECFKPQSATQFDHALSTVYQSAGAIKIHQLAAVVGWSSRHLNRMFQRHVGLSTKTFAQTIRIQHACKQLVTSGSSLNAAFELGFFDQSHLIKDCKKRLLSTPGSLFDRFVSDFYNN